MANESDELKLTVSLVDNATPQLRAIREQVQAIGGGEAGNAMNQFRRRSQEAHESMRPFNEDLKHAAEHLLPGYVRGVAGVATGFLALGIAAEKTVDQLRDFSTEMSKLDRLSKETGVSAGQIRQMMETFERAGVSADAAKKNIAGFAAAMADLTRPDSPLRAKLLAGAGLNKDAMLQWLTGLRSEDLDAQVNDVKAKADEVYQNMLDHQKRMGAGAELAAERAAQAKKTFLEAFGAPDLIQVMERFEKMSPEEQAAWDARVKAGKDFEKVSSDIAIQWDKITASWKTDALQNLLPVLQGIDKFFKDWADKGFIGAGKELGAHEKELYEKSPSSASVPQAFMNWWRGKGFQDKEVPQHQEGGIISQNQYAMLHAGEIVQPAEGVEQIKKQTTATEQLTEQMKDLNDYLTGVFTGATVRMGGLAPGLGVGPAGQRVASLGGGGLGAGGAGGAGAGGGFAGALASFAGGGGGFGGIGNVLGIGGSGMGNILGGAGAGAGGDGSVPRGQGYGPTGSDGSGSQPHGSDTGGTGGIKSDPAVPSDILKTAQHVALQGGPGAVEQFMRQQGYPKAGNWCGEFAASVVKASGGTPPKNPQVASNWRNWGQQVSTPQPGDIAVANRGVRTGALGSHVTFVEDVNAKTGTFTGLGGNQRAGFESHFKTSGYTFYRSQGPRDVGPGTGKGAGDTAGGGAGAGTEPASGAGSSVGGGTTGVGGPGGALYEKLLREFKANPPKGIPPDAARFGITKGTPEEWARFGVSVAHAESGFNPREKNLSDPGGSFGVFQYAHSQVPGGNAYDVDASVKAFVRDADKSAVDKAGLRGGILGRRFSTIGRHPDVGAAYLAQAGKLGAEVDRAQMDRSMTQKVEGTGKIDVNVNAPKGTQVAASGGGLFKKVNVARNTQMDHASPQAVAAMEE